jgi:hypothetical protein
MWVELVGMQRIVGRTWPSFMGAQKLVVEISGCKRLLLTHCGFMLEISIIMFQAWQTDDGDSCH